MITSAPQTSEVGKSVSRPLRIAMLGGDRREIVIASSALAAGAGVTGFGLPWPEEGIEGMSPAESPVEAAAGANVLLLPLPGMQAGTIYAPDSAQSITIDDEVLRALAPGAIVITGTANEHLREAVRLHGLQVVEYEHDHAGRIDRAAAIAEGALARMVLATDITLNDAYIVLLGFGVIASQLAVRLRALGAHVHVFARSADAQSLARAAGLVAYGQLADVDLGRAQLLVNTVPARLVTGELLAGVPKSCTIFDLASPPGGIDLEAAQRSGHRAHWLRGLGSTSPASVGRAQWRVIRTLIDDHFPGALQ